MSSVCALERKLCVNTWSSVHGLRTAFGSTHVFCRVDISDTLMYVYEMLGAELLSSLYDKLGRLLTNTEQPSTWQVSKGTQCQADRPQGPVLALKGALKARVHDSMRSMSTCQHTYRLSGVCCGKE